MAQQVQREHLCGALREELAVWPALRERAPHGQGNLQQQRILKARTLDQGEVGWIVACHVLGSVGQRLLGHRQSEGVGGGGGEAPPAQLVRHAMGRAQDQIAVAQRHPGPGALRLQVPPLQEHWSTGEQREGDVGPHRPQPALKLPWLVHCLGADSFPWAIGREIKRGQGGTRRWLQHARASSGICLRMGAPTAESYVGLRSPPESPHGRSREIGASSLLMAPLASDLNTPSGMTTCLQSVQAPGVVGSQLTR